ncbi:DEAD/DEAH box helicase [Flammeovirgaceae bacterium SG7u.111]|nr:DEAD/DEAH box helicase [Flammeovirgaceae bacterium SG7u.132]WPO38749.1 DEAD/DEAH box helicase [Flammeovirgaceae bacterium SG7u.111]
MAEEKKSFEDFKLNKQLLNAIADAGYTTPTPIQEKAIPRILAGQDIFGIAQTGTGKTAAYLLPLLMKVKYAQGEHPRALIIAPTRELVIQIDKEISKLGAYTDLRHVALYGGIGPTKQIESMAGGVDIVVGTPGRIIDIYQRGGVFLRQVKTMILDEADRMMDMGFMPQIRSLLELLPGKRQHMLFSATMPEKVVKLSEEFLEFPEMIEVTPPATTAETIEQCIYRIPNFKSKIHMLLYLLEDTEEFKRVIVFVRRKETADNIGKFLTRKAEGDIRIVHANKGQNSRINAIDAFKDGGVRVLVSTDVSSRGLDVSMVSHVINFDVPVMYDDYVHRIGRTGRAENEGKAITFCNPAESYHINKIKKLIRMQVPELPVPDGVEITPTDFHEKQEQDREIDEQKKKDNPNYKGAFHEKKKRPLTSKEDAPWLHRNDKKKKNFTKKKRRK